MDRLGDVLELMDQLPQTDMGLLAKPLELPAVRAALELPDELVAMLAGHVLERVASQGLYWRGQSTRGLVERRVLSALAHRPRRWALEDVELLLGLAVRLDQIWRAPDLLEFPLVALEGFCATQPVGALEPLVRRLIANVEAESSLSSSARGRLRSRLSAVLAAGSEAVDVSLFSDADGWGVAMRDWLDREPLPIRETNSLLSHFASASSVSPNAKWKAACVALLAALPDAERVVRAMLDAAVAHTARITLPYWESRGASVVANNAALLRGAIWAAEILDRPWLTELVGRLGVHYGMSPEDNNFARDEKVAATCASLLGRLGEPGASGLGLMKLSVRSRAVLKQVDRALSDISEQTGTPLWRLLESAVPTFGLDETGRKTVGVDGTEAEVAIADDGKVSVSWRRGDAGANPEAVAALKAEAKAIEKRSAIERSQLEINLIAPRSWTVAEWRERYLRHPLTRPWARHLIWRIEEGGSTRLGMPLDGTIEGVDGPVDVGPDATVRPWHPILAMAAEVEAWRRWLLDRELRQPFKQVFREVYRLSQAEEDRAASARFAGHVLHYRQASALMSARRWNANHLGFWDGGYDGVAKRTFESHGIRAEFDHQLARDEETIGRIEEQRESLAGDATQPLSIDELVARLVEAAKRLPEQDAGTGYQAEEVRYCRTGDVRFFLEVDGNGSRPLRLRDVPPEVFSEAMRDVDLFVSVSSVAIDQLWRDLGEPRVAAYRDLSAFAVLPESAQTRRGVLQRLIPRSRIADRCTFQERYLRVRGDLRAYRIHLGSAQVLMEPNDQHLFVALPKGRDAAEANGIFMPFDDTLLGHVLGKAFLLADDAKITDQALRRQITG